MKDTVNRKMWYFTQGQPLVFYQDLTLPVPRPLESVVVQVENGAPNNGYVPVYDFTWLFVPEAKAALAFAGGGTEITAGAYPASVTGDVVQLSITARKLL